MSEMTFSRSTLAITWRAESKEVRREVGASGRGQGLGLGQTQRWFGGWGAALGLEIHTCWGQGH